MRSSRWVTLVLRWVAILAAATGVATFASLFLPTHWAVLSGVITAALVVVIIWFEVIAEIVEKLVSHPLAILFALLTLLAVMAPVLALSVVSCLKLVSVEEAVTCAHRITTSPHNRGVYRAVVDRPAICSDGGRIAIDYLPSAVGDEEMVLGFSYNEIAGRLRCELETSGAYITFYEDPIEFYEFASLSFSVAADKGEESLGVDFAVKLTVDNPGLPARDREVAVRVSPPMQELRQCRLGHWERITVDLGEFSLLPYLRPADGVDPDRINKIVFFVDSDILDRYPSGIVLIKDIVFEKRTAGCP